MVLAIVILVVGGVLISFSSQLSKSGANISVNTLRIMKACGIALVALGIFELRSLF